MAKLRKAERELRDLKTKTVKDLQDMATAVSALSFSFPGADNFVTHARTSLVNLSRSIQVYGQVENKEPE